MKLEFYTEYELQFFSYCIRRNIDSDFNLAIWQSHKDCQINLRHYRSFYTTYKHGVFYRQYSKLPI